MPSKPHRPCTHPGCGTLTKQGKCDKHRTDYEQQRGSSSSRGYDGRWRKLRRLILADEPLCRECQKNGVIKPATDIDHIISKRHGGTDDRSNLQPLCHECHSAKTMRGE